MSKKLEMKLGTVSDLNMADVLEWHRLGQGRADAISVETLAAIVDKGDRTYHRLGAEPLMTDAEYDVFKKALAFKMPDHPLLTRIGVPYEQSEVGDKKKHVIPMGSLTNTDGGIEGAFTWWEKVGLEHSVMASLKIDGMSLAVSYRGGKMVSAITRGNGTIGEDVTANAARFEYLPIQLDNPSLLWDVRGEVVLFKEDHRAILSRDFGQPFDMIPVEDRSNPRSVGNGIVARSSGVDSEMMRFIAFRCCEGPWPPGLTEAETFQMLETMRFNVVPHRLCILPAELQNYYESVLEARAAMPFEIDGIVLCLNSVSEQWNRTTADPKSFLLPAFARAVKFPTYTAETEVIGCAITVGHSGAIVPTANLKEVRVGGVQVDSALLSNWEEIKRLDVAIGDLVVVELAGDVIPRIQSVKARPAPGVETRTLICEPVKCPECDMPTTRILRGSRGAVLYCVAGDACPGVAMGKLKKWLGNSRRGLGVLGVGPAILKAAVKAGLLKDPSDLYRVNEGQWANLQLANGLLGQSRAQSIMQELKEKSRVSLPVFLGGLGIELLGQRRAEQLCKSGWLSSLDDWLNPTLWDSLELPGLGDTTKKAIKDGMLQCQDLISRLLSNGVTIVEREEVRVGTKGPLTGIQLCFTGTRSLLKEAEAAGAEIKDGVSKGLDYLIQLDPTKTSSKSKRASSLGIRVISVEELQEMLDGAILPKKAGS